MYRREFLKTVALALATLDVSAEEPSLVDKVKAYEASQRKAGNLLDSEKTAWLSHDYVTGRTLLAINPYEPLQAASMVKPFVALAYLDSVQRGNLIFDKSSEYHLEGALAYRKKASDKTISGTANSSASWLMMQVGGPRSTQRLLQSRYPQLSQHVTVVETIPENGKTYLNRASASDYSAFLHGLKTGDWALNSEYTQKLRVYMELPQLRKPRFTRIISKTMPKGIRHANKTGTTALCAGDFGIIYAKGEDGKTYPYSMIGIITGEEKDRAKYNGLLRTRIIRDVADMAYTHMKGLYGLK